MDRDRRTSWRCVPLLLAMVAACSDPLRDRSTCLPGTTDAPDDSIWVTAPFPEHHESPDWSLQGLIAYHDRGIVWVSPLGGVASVDTALAGLWTLHPDSGEKRRLLPTGDVPDWSADGRRIAFERGYRIYTVDRDGRDERVVTHDGRNYSPSWHPDGQWIAYELLLGTPYHVWAVRSDGTGAYQVESPGAGMPSWSPDGLRIAHVRGPSGEIYTMGAHGEDPRQITGLRRDTAYPEFSPDGQWIAFSSQRVGDRSLPQVWVARTDRSCTRQITAKGGTHPSWSPDSRRVVFTRHNWRTNSPENGVLWVVDVITLEERQLTFKWPERLPAPGTPLQGASAVSDDRPGIR